MSRRDQVWWSGSFALGLLGLAVLLAGCGGGSGATSSGVEPETKANGDPTLAPPLPEPAENISPFSKLDTENLKGHIANPAIPQDPSPFRFTNVLDETGIDFVQFSGMTEEKHYPSANGSGIAIFDYDGDGLMDIYFATATLLPLGTAEKGSNRLYKNNGDGTFSDVTESSGLGFQGFCHGIIVGDINNNGHPDVFLANYGPNRLYRNNGDGTFTDVSAEAGIENMDRTIVEKVKDDRGREVERERTLINWTSGGAMLDYDNDGFLDIYVSTHGDWRLPEDDQWCGFDDKGIRLYCSPRSIRTAKDILFRNNGDGTFTDVTDEVGIGRSDGHGFGVVAVDVNLNGLTDIYVANDQNPNFLFINNGDGTFTDATEMSGAAFDDKGVAQSGMGIDAEDIDGDGLPELFCTNFQNEYNTVYRNAGQGFFTDFTSFYGLGQDRHWVGWGTALADFDNDGWPDCFITNGYVDDNHPDYPYGEPPLLYKNVPLGTEGKQRRFRLATRDVGEYFDTTHVGRGAAFGDLNNDGKLDILVNHKDAPPAILLNETPTGDNRWIRLILVGTQSNRDAIGSLITVEVGDRTIHRQRKGGGSMLSTNDPRILIGLGAVEQVDRLTIRWPSGQETVLEDLEVDTDHEIVEPSE